MQWLRLYHDTPNDPKWRVVAVRSGQPVGNVLAVWMQMLVCASEAEERGILEGWDDETVAAVLGYPPAVVTVIRACMQGLVLDGLRLTGWDKRQRASDTSAERVQRHRNRTKKPDPGGNSGNGLDPEAHTAKHQSDVTVTLQTENVTLHSDNVTSPPLRAQTPDLQKEEESVAKATGAAAPSGGTVVPFPVDDKGRLYGPVLDALVARLPGKAPCDIRAMLAKAYHKIDPSTAVALGAMAIYEDEPWSWLCKAIDTRIKPKQAAGGRPAKPVDPALERLLRRQAEAQEQFDLRGAL